MNNPLTYIEIPLRGVPKQSFRVGKNAYQTKTVRKYQEAVNAYVSAHMKRYNIPMQSKPLALEIVFTYRRPEKMKHILRDGDATTKYSRVYRTSRPDIDNLCKGVLDSLRGALYEDDSIVCDIKASKVYGIKDEICIDIEVLPEGLVYW